MKIYTALIVLMLLGTVALQLWLGMSILVAIIITAPAIVIAWIPMKMDAKFFLYSVLLGLVSAVPILKYFFGISTLSAIAVSVLVIPVVAFNCVPSMSYSLNADVALKRLVQDLRTELVVGSQGILDVEGIWGYGWPKVVILFSSIEALEKAEANGFINQLASRITEMVKSDRAYGRNRNMFDSKEAVSGFTDRSMWDECVAKRSFP
ncbi:MAG: hypothetical protein IPJ48_01945 [Propionivibrio sp.]|uniref:Uncharacterized protein n=1 Tax=Candidatus Propionivibrio dominans TaxID=2954373 RepID=A0A9D7F4J4_9RHOO|nr:hypothetical protein [Candidatus Propionivibrio dominans]MBL0168623.1 hypothetical protein [Propionivibrio sp.]